MLRTGKPAREAVDGAGLGARSFRRGVLRRMHVPPSDPAARRGMTENEVDVGPSTSPVTTEGASLGRRGCALEPEPERHFGVVVVVVVGDYRSPALCPLSTVQMHRAGHGYRTTGRFSAKRMPSKPPTRSRLRTSRITCAPIKRTSRHARSYRLYSYLPRTGGARARLEYRLHLATGIIPEQLVSTRLAPSWILRYSYFSSDHYSSHFSSPSEHLASYWTAKSTRG